MAIGRIFSGHFDAVGVTAAQDLFELGAPAGGIVEVMGVLISQYSDAGDSESEQLSILFHRGTATGSGGSTVTPVALDGSGDSFTGTLEANNTTQSVEANVLLADAFNVMAGYQWMPPPELYIVVPPSGLFIVELTAAPADSLTMNGTIFFREVA